MLETGIKFIKYLKSIDIEAYIVGGAVRDYLLNNDIKDIDIAVKTNPDILQKALSNYNLDLSGIKYGSVKLVYEDVLMELTCFRYDLEYLDNRHPSVVYTTDILVDAKRRDFTINAMYLDADKQLIDPLNGKIDLDNKILRTCISADKSFKEDSLRMLRMIKFSLRLDFKIAVKPMLELLKNQQLLVNSKNRIKEELDEILRYNCLEYLILFDYFRPFANELNLICSNDLSLQDKYLILNLNKDLVLNYSKAEKKYLTKYKKIMHDLSVYCLYENYEDRFNIQKLAKIVYNEELDFSFSIKNRKSINITVNEIKEYTNLVSKAYKDIETRILLKTLDNNNDDIKAYLKENSEYGENK